MAIKRGDKAALFLQTTAVKTTVTGEACSALGNNWFKVTNAAKSLWDPESSVVIKDSGSAVTPIVIEFTGGYFLLGSTPGGAVTADFSYFAAAQVGGVRGFDLDMQQVTEESGCIGDLGSKPEAMYLKWTLKANKHFWDVKASLTTAFAGNNNDMILVARSNGIKGNDISLECLGGVSQTLAVRVNNGTDIIVQLGTNGSGTITSTTNDVRAAMYANDAIMFLLQSILNSGGDDGTGTPAIMAHTHLTGGLDPDYLTRMLTATKVAVIAYIDSTGGILERFEGIGEITKVEDTVVFGKITQEPLEITGFGRIARHLA
jgi:hypothetical protein